MFIVEMNISAPVTAHGFTRMSWCIILSFSCICWNVRHVVQFLMCFSMSSQLWLSCFFTLLWSGQFCHSLYITSHRPGIVLGDGWIHNNHILFCRLFMCMDGLLGLSLYVVFIIFNLSNSFVSVRLFIMADWALWASTLLAQHKIFD